MVLVHSFSNCQGCVRLLISYFSPFLVFSPLYFTSNPKHYHTIHTLDNTVITYSRKGRIRKVGEMVRAVGKETKRATHGERIDENPIALKHENVALIFCFCEVHSFTIYKCCIPPFFSATTASYSLYFCVHADYDADDVERGMERNKLLLILYENNFSCVRNFLRQTSVVKIFRFSIFVEGKYVS